jgi:hypothetical protein
MNIGSENMTSMDYVALPVNYLAGFPQIVFAEIDKMLFSFTYRFNSYDDSLILTWKKGDGTVVFQGRLSEGCFIPIKSPTNGIEIGLLTAEDISEDNVDIRLFIPWS